MRFYSIPMRNLARRPMRSSLTALGVAAAVASFLAMMGISQGFDYSFVKILLERDTHILAVRKGTAEILAGALRADLAKELAGVEGVRSVSGELMDLVPLDSGPMALVAGWPPESRLWKSLHMETGRLPKADAPAEISVGAGIAEELNLKPGGTLRILEKRFTVVGTFKNTSTMGNNMIILPIAAMEALMGLQDRVTAFNIQVDRPDDPDRIAATRQRLGQAFPDLRFWETEKVSQNNDLLKMMRAMSWAVSVVAIGMGLVFVLNTLLMSVTERTHEIGVLSALGWSARRILAMIAVEGLALAAIGSAIGTGLGLGGLYLLSCSPQIRGFIEPRPSPHLLGEVVVVALVLGAVASIYPAWRAVRINTMDALRHE